MSMHHMEALVVAAVVLGAALYLWKAFKPKNGGGNCGCGNTVCKLPKRR